MNATRKKATLLDDIEIEAALGALPGWQLDQNKLYCELQFEDFPNAIEFMYLGIAPCEAMDHHPEWFNCYDRVEIWLTTHDSGGITEKDIELAQQLSAIANSIKQTA